MAMGAAGRGLEHPLGEAARTRCCEWRSMGRAAAPGQGPGAMHLMRRFFVFSLFFLWLLFRPDVLTPGRALRGLSTPRIQQAIKLGLPFRVFESASASQGGQPGVSNTFAATLWMIDFSLALFEHGASGITFHGDFSARNLYYSPFNVRALPFLFSIPSPFLFSIPFPFSFSIPSPFLFSIPFPFSFSIPSSHFFLLVVVTLFLFTEHSLGASPKAEVPLLPLNACDVHAAHRAVHAVSAIHSLTYQ